MDDAIEGLNAFLRGRRVLSVEEVADHGRHNWLRVEYLPLRPGETRSDASSSGSNASEGNALRLDHREILGKQEFDRSSKLRALRKQLAESDGVPVYTMLTNAQLAMFARCVPLSNLTLDAQPTRLTVIACSYGRPWTAWN